MRILPFRKPLAASEQARLEDWTQQEMADFYRAHRLLVENGVGIGIDRGLSDAGDPWMAFYDEATQEVFLHVARIDQACLLVCDQLELRITARTISEVISIFENEVRRIVSVRQERNSKIILHPAARIIMSISAVFLLFKLENTAAHAKEAGDETEGAAIRKHELAANARAQSALGRLYEMVDGPVAVAALAGLLISLELAMGNIRPASSDSQAAQDFSSLKVSIDPHFEEIQLAAVEQDAHVLTIAFPEPELVEISEKDLDLVIAVPVELPEESLDPTSGSLPPDSQPQRFAMNLDVIPLDAVSWTRAASQIGGAQKTGKSDSDEAAAPALALKIMETVLAGLELADDAAKTFLVQAKGGVGEITLANLGELNNVVATFLETELPGLLVTDALVHFLMSVADYEYEYVGRQVLLEQKHAAGLDEKLIGIWKNTLEDGSVISVVGHVDLIDDLASMVA